MPSEAILKDSFARRQMEKHGWGEGKGLGAKEDGSVDHIKVKKKADTAGIGADNSYKWDDMWWDRVYNSASQNLKVKHKDGEAVIKGNAANNAEEGKPVSMKSAIFYSGFVRANKADSDQGSSSSDSDSDSEDDTTPADKVFSACEGRMFGRNQGSGTGKHARVAAFEKQIQEKRSGASTPSSMVVASQVDEMVAVAVETKEDDNKEDRKAAKRQRKEERRQRREAKAVAKANKAKSKEERRKARKEKSKDGKKESRMDKRKDSTDDDDQQHNTDSNEKTKKRKAKTTEIDTSDVKSKKRKQEK